MSNGQYSLQSKKKTNDVPERIIAESISKLHSVTKVQMTAIQVMKIIVPSIRQDDQAAPVTPKNLLQLQLTNEFKLTC